MKVVKTYKYKLKPNKTQIKRFESWLGVCRYVYNSALEHRITAYKMSKVSIRKYDQYNELPQIKKDLPFIADVHSDVLQETLDRVDNSYQGFFKGKGFPKFQNKFTYRSFTFKRGIKVNNKTIKLPKIGEVKYFNSRPIKGDVKYSSIIKENNDYYISISVEQNDIKPIIVDNSQAVGIDVGIVHFATLSDNTYIDSNMFLEPKLRELRILNRKLSRHKKGSNSRLKTKNKLSKLHSKIKNTRNDFNQKQSTIIANKYSSCYVEDLKIKNMTKLNSTLSRRMLDNGFYSFRLMLEYKFKEKSKTFLAVNPAYTSQTCNVCGSINKGSRISQSEYICISCGNVDNADLNAAKNIMSKGITQNSKRKAIA